MDAYSRVYFEMEFTCWGCYGEHMPPLPSEMLDAVQEGDIETIRTFLNNDGNVNSAHDGECLLSRACAEGQTEIVKLLLQWPDIHPNSNFDEMMPIDRAAKNGHIECIEALLNSSAGCDVDIKNNWRSVAKCLKTRPQLHNRSAGHILRKANRHGALDVVQLMLDTDYHFVEEDLHSVVQQAILYCRWDIVVSVLQRDFYGKENVVKEAFGMAVTFRYWDKVKDLLQFIGSDLKFDSELVKAALSENDLEVQRLLSDKNYDTETHSGNLLVLCAAGINDQIATLLMSIKNVYSKETLANGLFLSAFSCCGEMISKLLYNSEASFTINDLHFASRLIDRNFNTTDRNPHIMDHIDEHFKKVKA